MDAASFDRLHEAPLHSFGPADWAAYYPAMAGFLAHEYARIRSAALERLTMATFRAEPGTLPNGEERQEAARRRARWFLGELERAEQRWPDLVPDFLASLRWHGDDEPFPDILLPWLRARRGRSDQNGEDGLIEGTILLIEGRHEGGTHAVQGWLGLLDHPSTWLRGCAARLLGEWSYPDEPDAFAPILKRVVAVELVRPGVAGPFWAGLDPDFDELPFDPIEWMLDLIERREGPEPDGMPFNGIDFYLHEIACGSGPAVIRLYRGGRKALALQTATELHGVAEGMRGPLHLLGEDDDPGMAQTACRHLALYYNALHPKADPSRLRLLRGWRPGIDAFLVRFGTEDAWSDVVVLYPAGESGAFDDASAWPAIDAVLPPSLRGDLARHFLAPHGSDPAPFSFGNCEVRDYASGPQISLEGDLASRRWSRIEITGRRLQGRWNPFETLIAES